MSYLFILWIAIIVGGLIVYGFGSLLEHNHNKQQTKGR